MAPGRSSTLNPARPCPLGRPHPSLLVKGAARTRSTALPHSWAAALRSGEEGWRTVVRPLRCVRGRCRAQRRGRAGHAPTPTAHPHPNTLARLHRRHRTSFFSRPHRPPHLRLPSSLPSSLPSPLSSAHLPLLPSSPPPLLPSSPPPLLPSSPPPLLPSSHPPLLPPSPPPILPSSSPPTLHPRLTPPLPHLPLPLPPPSPRSLVFPRPTSPLLASGAVGRCGRLHHSLGGSHTFRCPHPPCDYRSERDAHGARNIMAMNVERYVGTVVVPVQHAGTGGQRQQRQLQRGARVAAAAPAAAARDGKEEKQQQPAPAAAAEQGEEDDELWLV